MPWLCMPPLLAYVGTDAVTTAALVIVYFLILCCFVFLFFFNWVTAVNRTVGRISQVRPAPDCSLIKY